MIKYNVMVSIRDNVKNLIKELPEGIILVAAVKGRSPNELLEAVDAGISIVGENYLQEAESHFKIIGNRVKKTFLKRLKILD